MSDEIREERFTANEDEIEIVSKSGSGLVVTPEVIARARARVAAGEDIQKVAFDVATEDVALRSAIGNP